MRPSVPPSTFTPSPSGSLDPAPVHRPARLYGRSLPFAATLPTRPPPPTGLEVSDLTTLYAALTGTATLVVWALLLRPDGHFRDTMVLWGLALPLVLWVNPLGRQRRWAVRSLPLALVVWPLLGLLGVTLDLVRRSPHTHVLPTRLDAWPLMLGMVLASVLLARLAARAHRRHTEHLAWEASEWDEEDPTEPMDVPHPGSVRPRMDVNVPGDARARLEW